VRLNGDGLPKYQRKNLASFGAAVRYIAVEQIDIRGRRRPVLREDPQDVLELPVRVTDDNKSSAISWLRQIDHRVGMLRLETGSATR